MDQLFGLGLEGKGLVWRVMLGRLVLGWGRVGLVVRGLRYLGGGEGVIGHPY